MSEATPASRLAIPDRMRPRRPPSTHRSKATADSASEVPDHADSCFDGAGDRRSTTPAVAVPVTIRPLCVESARSSSTIWAGPVSAGTENDNG